MKKAKYEVGQTVSFKEHFIIPYNNTGTGVIKDVTLNPEQPLYSLEIKTLKRVETGEDVTGNIDKDSLYLIIEDEITGE